MAYDLITIGGGLGGAALAKVMAEAGARVLVLEREIRFRDRVRGEGMHPWGVNEAKELGLYEPILAKGNQTRFFSLKLGHLPADDRDLVETSPHAMGELGLLRLPYAQRRAAPLDRKQAGLRVPSGQRGD